MSEYLNILDKLKNDVRKISKEDWDHIKEFCDEYKWSDESKILKIRSDFIQYDVISQEEKDEFLKTLQKEYFRINFD